MAMAASKGSGLAGQEFNLTCTITVREDKLNSSVDIQWIGPNGTAVVSVGSLVVGDPVISEGTTSLTLQFTSLFTSHGGEYTCVADLESDSTVYTVSVLQDVIVQGT